MDKTLIDKYVKENIPYYRYVEIPPEFVGTAGFNIKPYSVSSPRLHMLSSQIGQKPAILHGQPTRIFTGIEREHGKNLLSVTVPCDCIVKEVIAKYAGHLPDGQASPHTLVIIERVDDNDDDELSGCIDRIIVPHNHCKHQTFGFQYIRTPAMRNIYPGQSLRAGTILAKPITLNEDGDWCLGRNLRMGLMPSEEGIEDGLCISESTAKKYAMYGYGTVEMSFGKSKVLLNIHGDEKTFKPWLNIGDIIPADGLIIAGREYDVNLAPANMSSKSLRRANQRDDPKYGIPGAKIVDIKIIKGNNQTSNLPPEIESWVDRYWDRTLKHNQSIINYHKKAIKDYKTPAYGKSPAWARTVFDAMSTVNAKNGARKETYRNSPLDDTLIIIQYEYIFIPKKGAKYTCRQAGKGVSCRVKPDHLMPLDAKGRRLDAYMDDISTSNRMNTPRLDEVLITSCAETATDMMREEYERSGDVDKTWQILLDFYKIISPPMYEIALATTDLREREDEIRWIIQDPDGVPDHLIAGIRIASPSDMPIDWVKALDALKDAFPPLYDYLTIFDHEGNPVKTKYKTLVGELYMISLERAAQRFAATASARRQHHAIPVKPSKSERTSSPINDSPTRTFGEDETRGIAALLGGYVVAEVYDRNLNPVSHQQECRSIYAAKNPARIRNTVPRNESQLDPTVANQKIIPISGGRVVEIRDHTLYCGGVMFAEGEDGDSIE